MEKERRNHEQALPNKMAKALNSAQLLTLRNLEKFGWTLGFVRQPLFAEPIPVVFGADGETIGIIDTEGNLNVNADLIVRDSGRSDK